MGIEFLSAGPSDDCGCLEEHYLFNGIDLYVHFEKDGDVDGFLDWGDDEATVQMKGLTPEHGRERVFQWASGMTEPYLSHTS